MEPERMTIEDFRQGRRGGTPALAIAVILTCCCPSTAETGDMPPVSSSDRTDSKLGIGFLWTAQSERVVGRLKSEKDFVDLVLGPGKLDVFEKVEPPLRIACIARALARNDERPFPGIKETIELLRTSGVAPDRVIITYNPEGQPGTPAQEFRDLVASSRKAHAMAQTYGAPLSVAPGLGDMKRREHLYPELAKTCEIWMIQSQRLQLDEATRKPVEVGVYREKVKRIVDLLREGNPNIQIFVQLVTTAERGTEVLSGEQIAAFARSIEDLVDAVRIYGASADLLNQIIDRLRGPLIDADAAIDAGAANVRQFGRECPWVRASVGRPTFIGNAEFNNDAGAAEATWKVPEDWEIPLPDSKNP